MTNEQIPLKCPRCGHTWQRSAAEIRRQYEQMIYKGDPPPGIEEYRVQCPVDHTYFIVGLPIQN
jgi:hypothetical protein